jgi:ubiquinone/menaquinone biosynthesis C-methylase UbiE
LSDTRISNRSFSDHFSGHASEYAVHRPRYPEALYRFLADQCQDHNLAWDCATGNGQAALSLTEYFDRVIATDASAEQVAAATAHPRISYSVVPAEGSGIEEASIDLLTIAQALHWFNLDAFFSEANRVVKPGGLLAAWTYADSRVNNEVDSVIDNVIYEVEDYWPPERDIVMNLYRDITFPWTEIEVPAIHMQENWTVDQLLGYIRTWSASKRYQKDRGADPVSLHESTLRNAWGVSTRTVTWPLTLKVVRR